MALQFPTSPTLNQIHQDAGIVYQWNGTKWKRMDIYQFPSVLEYTDIVEQTSANVDIQPDKYNYYKINLNADATITLPTSDIYSSFIMELNKTVASTSYDLQNASYDNTSYTIPDSGFDPRDFVFKPDGTKMYIIYDIGDEIRQFTLSTPWDISTANYDTVLADVTSETINPRGVAFKPDGTKMYIVSTSSNIVHQYTLSTAWDVGTASYDTVSFSVINEDDFPYDIDFNSDGSKLYMLGSGLTSVYQYSLSTPWDVGTSSYDTVSFSTSNEEYLPSILEFGSDGSKMYISGSGYGNIIYQYSSGLSGSSNITWSNNIQWAGDTAPTLDYAYITNILLHFVTYDGVNWVAQQLSLDLRSS